MEPINSSQQVTPPLVAPVINQTPPPPSFQKKKGKLWMLIALVIILFLLSVSAVAGFVIYKNLNKQPEQVACTMEALICPDGSSVGRTGPNCEFSPCPTSIPDPTANWEIYTNTVRGYSVRHPLSFKIIETPNSPTTMEEVSLQKNVIIGPGAQGGETALSGIIISISYFDALDISEERLKQTYGNQITIVQTVLGDKPAIEIKGEFIKDRYLYITLANGYLRIQATDADRPMDSEKLEQYLPTERAIQEEIDQILSTFKFTNSEKVGSFIWDVNEESIPQTTIEEIKTAFSNYTPVAEVGEELVVVGLTFSEISPDYSRASLNAKDMNNKPARNHPFEYLLVKRGDTWEITDDNNEKFCSVLRTFPEDINEKDFYVGCFTN